MTDVTGRGGCWQRQEKKIEDEDQEKKIEAEDQDKARSRRLITPSTRRQGRGDKTPAGASVIANYTSRGKLERASVEQLLWWRRVRW